MCEFENGDDEGDARSKRVCERRILEDNQELGWPQAPQLELIVISIVWHAVQAVGHRVRSCHLEV